MKRALATTHSGVERAFMGLTMNDDNSGAQTVLGMEVRAAMSRLNRSEVEVFAELERLCQSPGYSRVIARMCLLDNMISYAGEVVADDMLKLYDPTRLARNEMNVCIGLWAKGERDFEPLSLDDVAPLIEQTRRLCEELHCAMNEPTIAAMRQHLAGKAAASSNPIASGGAMREAIFYGGESAYAFQYRDFAPARYAADETWIRASKEFSMTEAAAVARVVSREIDARASLALSRSRGSFDKIDDALELFTFSAREVSEAARLPAKTCERVLAAFACPDDERNAQFTKMDARNMAAILPVMRRGQSYVVFNVVDFYEALYQAPYFWMLEDKSYKLAANHRGQFTEEFARQRLTSVFGAGRTLSNVILMRSKAVVGEVDVLVTFSKFAIIVQAKSKQLTAVARQGDEKQIQKDFTAAVQSACDQGMDCAKMLFDSAIKWVDADGEAVARPAVEKVFVVCLVADHYPALAAQARQFLQFESVDGVAAPLVMDVFLLDALTEMLDSPLYFLNYLDRRSGYADQVMSNHELSILGFHLVQNLHMQEDANLFHLGDDFGVDLELAMLARREGLRAPWTPKGILTILDGTALGALLKGIERRPEPGMVELGFAILAMSSEALNQANSAISEVMRLSRSDGGRHDFTMQLKDGVGLTFHSSSWPEQQARDGLMDHCARRKYVQRSSRWFGVLLDPAAQKMRCGVMLNSPWKHDAQLDSVTAHMSRKSNISNAQLREFVQPRASRMVGRNAPCPCGSGKVSKRCCQTKRWN
jgi:uncharacterized protein YchJ